MNFLTCPSQIRYFSGNTEAFITCGEAFLSHLLGEEEHFVSVGVPWGPRRAARVFSLRPIPIGSAYSGYKVEKRGHFVS